MSNQDKKSWRMYRKAVVEPTYTEYEGNPWGDAPWEIVESSAVNGAVTCNIECTTPAGVWRVETLSSKYGSTEKDVRYLFDNNTSTSVYSDSLHASYTPYLDIVIIPPTGCYLNVSSMSVAGSYAQGSHYINMYTYDEEGNEVVLLNSYIGYSATSGKQVAYQRPINVTTDIYAPKIKFRMYNTGSWTNFHIKELAFTKCTVLKK